MKTQKLILIALMILILTVSAHAFVRNQYWECTSDGEASQGDAFGRREGEVCQVTCCILCVSSSPSIDCIGSNAQPQCACNSGSNGTVDTSPPEITFVAPTNNTTYNDADILLHVTTNEKALYMKYAFDSSSLRSFCSNCNDTTRTESRMGDGLHSVRIEAKDLAGNIAQKKIFFTVDTTPPIIESLVPGNNAFVAPENEVFTVKYTESSLQSAKLFYKKSSDGSYQQASFTGCASGESKSCNATANFNGYAQGQVVQVYVELKDDVNTVQSPVYTLTINSGLAQLPFVVTSPGNNSVFNSRSVDFTIQSFLEGASFDYSTDGVTFKKLCSGTCTSFTKKLSLLDGNNQVIVRLVDSSLNHYDQTLNFFIDSRKPSISKLDPKGGNEPIGGSPFVVEYTEEEDTEQVILHYGVGSFQNHVIRTDCPTGKKVTCEFDIDLSSFDGQTVQYAAEVRDRASNVTSKTQSGRVDTSDPILTAGALANVQEKNVLFSLNISEEVTLEYSDNGEKFTKLCSQCTSYNKQRSFTDGPHQVLVRAMDDAGNKDEHTYNFTVDSAAPKINGFDLDKKTNGTLILLYSEVNPVEVVLSYRNSNLTGWTNKTFTNCPGSSKGVCALPVNLGAFNNQTLEFTAYMKDIAGRTVAMKNSEKAVVDTITPVLTVTSPTSGSSYDGSIMFTLQSSEPIDLFYSTDGGVKSTKLCSACSSYNKARSFKAGNYSIIFSAIDPAGNTAQTTKAVSVF